MPVRTLSLLVAWLVIIAACKSETPPTSSVVATSPTAAIATTQTPRPQLNQFYVSLAGNDSWSGRFPDSNGEDGPFRTLARAQEAVRLLLASNIQTDVEVIIRGGDYYLDAPLILDERDSGRNGHMVIYRAAEGETPVLYGGQLLDNWQPYTNDIYVTDVGPAADFNTLYENDQRAVVARHPNEGYLRALPVNGDPYRQFVFGPDELPVSDDVSELETYIWPAGPLGIQNWSAQYLGVESIDYNRRIISLTGEAQYVINAGGSRYFLQGKLQLLDHPGEFYLDRTAGKLYYWPYNLPIDRQQIIAPQLTHLLWIVGSEPSKPVHNVRIQGLTFSATNFPAQNQPSIYSKYDAMIFISNAEDIELLACQIVKAGLNGVTAYQYARRISIEGNLIEQTGFHGVLVQGQLGPANVSSNNRIVNNLVRHTGQLLGHGTGITIEASSENTVAHNRIYDTPQHSLSLKSLPPAWLIGTTRDGVAISADNVDDYLNTRGNLVAFNDLSEATTDSQDTGVIETWGLGPTYNRIENNLIHDSDIPFSYGFGIYIDDSSDYLMIRNNVIYNLQQSGAGDLWSPLMVKGVGSQVVNNIVANNHALYGSLESLQTAPFPNHSLVIRRNIFANNGTDNVFSFINWSKERFTDSDYNLFFDQSGQYNIHFYSPGDYPNHPTTLDEWKNFLGRPLDAKSVTADPMFVNPENGDFRLRCESPARALGIENIDIPAIGLEADFPFANPYEPLDRLFLTSDLSDYEPCLTLHVDETSQLTLVGRTLSGYVADLSGTLVTFQSSDPRIVLVDRLGQIRGVTPGLARIVVTAKEAELVKVAYLEIVVKSD